MNVYSYKLTIRRRHTPVAFMRWIDNNRNMKMKYRIEQSNVVDNNGNLIDLCVRENACGEDAGYAVIMNINEYVEVIEHNTYDDAVACFNNMNVMFEYRNIAYASRVCIGRDAYGREIYDEPNPVDLYKQHKQQRQHG